MLYIRNTSTNPYFNLAVEEYFLKNSEDECFILWQNQPCVVIGKNQNALSEINVDYVKEQNIPVVRRLSGGGAVFHDLGNINFTFITNKDKNEAVNFSKFTLPIIAALHDLGINGEFSGRNDITIDGKKFSGNAQYYYKDRVLHHGTLLFSGNLTDLSQALQVKPQKFEDKGVKSVVSRVTNISQHLPSPMTVLEFKDYLEDHVLKANNISQVYELSNTDLEAIENLVKERYSTWEWNFGSSPQFSLSNEKRFPGGTVEINLDVKKGVIQAVRIFGDFFGVKDVSHIENTLQGVRHHEEDIRKALELYDMNEYFLNITLDDILSILF